MQCYGWHGKDGTGKDVFFVGCASNPGWTPNTFYGGRYYFPSDDNKNITGVLRYGATPISITPLFSEAKFNAWIADKNYLGNCSSCISSQQKYDNLNGECVPSSAYDTPGIYESKEACELANKYNFTEQEFDEINRLINSIKDKKCG